MSLKALAIIGLLLTLGLPVGVRAGADPPLVTAAKAGDSARVAALLNAGAEPDSHDSARNTALIFAARDGREEIARMLLAAGASVNWQDGELVSPLIIASFKNHPAVVKLLLDAGADVSVRDQWNRTALIYALRRGGGDAIARLIKAAR